ncbi:MAG: hypothetical protein QF473_10795 [Planctomycetota bacterium]|nr:hypothetical protein [Planctomycetota bacterium]
MSIVIAADAAASEKMPEGLLFKESFDDAELKKRNWYDLTRSRIVGSSVAGKGCIEYEWDKRSQTQGSVGMRRLLKPTGEIYIRFYLKLSKGWGWTGRNYRPHLSSPDRLLVLRP